MSRPKLLDLFCCAGGAAMGYHRAGFDVTGIDIDPQPNYPFEFIQADARDYLAAHWREYDAVHASPPCQTHTALTKGNRQREGWTDEHVDFRGWRHGTYYDGPYLAVHGDGGGKGTVAEWQQAMGIDWTNVRREIAEAIPPAYTEHIGAQLLAHLEAVAA